MQLLLLIVVAVGFSAFVFGRSSARRSDRGRRELEDVETLKPAETVATEHRAFVRSMCGRKVEIVDDVKGRVPRSDEAVVAVRTSQPIINDTELEKLAASPAFVRKSVALDWATHERLVDERGRPIPFSASLLPQIIAECDSLEQIRAERELDAKRAARAERRREQRKRRAAALKSVAAATTPERVQAAIDMLSANA